MDLGVFSMSDYKVPYTTILNIAPHNNAERLEIATVYGFQVIVQKDRYKVGDRVIYVPIDSILPKSIEEAIFGPTAKIKLHNGRVRQIRIRGLASQGMLIAPEELAPLGFQVSTVKDEEDLSTALKITKYEPPTSGFAQTQGKDKQRNKTYEHPLFHKYNGLDNIKWFPNLFQEGEEVVIQEKLHGANARASLLPFQANTFWKKVIKLLHIAPKIERCYGSNTVQKQANRSKGYYEDDIWAITFKNLKVFTRLKLGETVYGEIVGPSIQNNYDYGLFIPTFFLFDVKILQSDGKQKWLNPKEVQAFAMERGFSFVPVLYEGPFNKEQVYELTKGPSVLWPKHKTREGIVIKSSENYDNEGNKRALKWISEAYLDDKNNTDFH